ncbi:MAG: helix-turn-helix domain-containing protein, partial [Candidatus Kariarchaeaceae archaeon]
MSELNELLTKIGFSENELKVYEVVVAFNFRTIGQINSYTNIGINEVQNACESLVSKNFLKKIIHKSPEAAVFIPLTPKIAITASVSKNLSANLQKLSSLVNKLWQEAQSHIDTDLEKIIST